MGKGTSWSYQPALDGIRCLAVYLVLLFHAGVPAAAGGFIGVDIFFVLSGFLISNVILSEIDRTGRLRLGHFYARRVRRLLPAALATVVATSVVFMLITPPITRLPFIRDAQSALLYFANWRFLFQANDYFGAAINKSPFLHFWSLSVEEQFYFFFPVLLIVATYLGRRRPRVLPTILSLLLVLSIGAQLYWARLDINHAYYGTGARLYQLAAGALLAVALRQRGAPLSARAALPLGVVGFAGLLVTASGFVSMTPSIRGLCAAALSVMLIAALMTPLRAGRLFSLPLPVYLGRISYGTYLWHWPVILVLLTVLHTRPLVIAVLAAAIGTGLAALSYQVLEMPIRRAVILDRIRWGNVAVGLTASAVVAITLVPTILRHVNRPALNTIARVKNVIRDGPGGDALIPAGINWQAVAHDYGPPDVFCTPADTKSCIVVKGTGPRVALVGDSNARMLAPMFIDLAKEHHFTLALNIVTACSWQIGVRNLRRPVAERKRCSAARDSWYKDVLPRLNANIVILVQMPRDDAEWKGKLVAADGSNTPLGELNLETMRKTLRQIHGAGARALIVDSIMGTGDVRPLDCLSSAKRGNECEVGVPVESPLSDAFYRTLTVRDKNVYQVNINAAVCPGKPVCQTIVDGVVVWRNRHHLTTKFAIHIRGKIWQRLITSGVLGGLLSAKTETARNGTTGGSAHEQKQRP